MVEPYQNFDDFVTQNGYQYGPQYMYGAADPLQPQSGEPAHNYALSVAKEIAESDIIRLESVGLNQTFNTAVTALAEADPADPAAGRMHYVAFVASPENPRTCVFTENITIRPDGTIQSQMEDGQCFSWMDHDEREAFYSLSDQFGHSAAAAPSAFRDFARANGQALGGEAGFEGDFKIGHEPGLASISSSMPINDGTGIELGNRYAADGSYELQLRIFRENAAGMMEAASGSAPGPASPERYQAFSGMDAGIQTFRP